MIIKPCAFAEKPPPELDIFRSANMLNSDGLKAMQTEGFKMAENSSSGALASARGMAKLAAAMADQGQVRIIQKLLKHITV